MTGFAVVTADWRKSARHTLALTVLGGIVGIGSESEAIGGTPVDSSINVSTLMVVATQSYFVGGVLGFQWGLAYLPKLNVAARGAGNTLDIDLDAAVDDAFGAPVLPRFGLYLRTKSVLAGFTLTGLLPGLEIAQVW
jgi:hypothetical protein